MNVLLGAPNLDTWRRDHTLLCLAIQTGLRISELTGLTCADIHLDTGAHIACHGGGPQTPDHCNANIGSLQ
ncbi:MAG: hypothetical protein ACRDR6_19960 [Pseudonocardiaceae bacterium]